MELQDDFGADVQLPSGMRWLCELVGGSGPRATFFRSLTGRSAAAYGRAARGSRRIRGARVGFHRRVRLGGDGEGGVGGSIEEVRLVALGTERGEGLLAQERTKCGKRHL